MPHRGLQHRGFHRRHDARGGPIAAAGIVGHIAMRGRTATGYRYLHEGIDVLAAAAPDLREVLEAGQAAGWTHVVLDGTLIRTDRCRTKNPDTGHDLWFSGKHKAHGGNVQIVSDPDGHPVAVS